jgi:hypothetical protein
VLARGALLISAVCLAGGAIAWRLSGKEKVLLAGSFHSVAHKGSGTAQIVQLSDGRLMLRLIQPKTYPSSNLDVCLIGAPDAEDNDTARDAGLICVGSFRSSASYSLPASTDLVRYRAVTIWDHSYQVNFTTAPLTGN